MDGFAYKNHSSESSSRLHMCRKVLGKEVKLFPWRKRHFKLYLPRLPSEAGKLLIWLSETLSVCSCVRFSPKHYGISNNLLLETDNSSRSLRLPIWGTSCVSWFPSSLSTCRLMSALMCGFKLLILLFLRSNFSKQGKF